VNRLTSTFPHSRFAWYSVWSQYDIALTIFCCPLHPPVAQGLSKVSEWFRGVGEISPSSDSGWQRIVTGSLRCTGCPCPTPPLEASTAPFEVRPGHVPLLGRERHVGEDGRGLGEDEPAPLLAGAVNQVLRSSGATSPACRRPTHGQESTGPADYLACDLRPAN